MNRTLNKRGSMLMMVMIMLIVAAIVAMKLMPDEQTQVIREKETFYNTDLSQLREAIDLARLAAKDPDPNNKLVLGGWEDFCATDTPVTIEAKLASLTEWGYLRKAELRDNSIPEFQWGTDKIYWQVSTNYASNTSFEIASGPIWTVAWEVDDKTATASVVDYIQLNSMAIDEYPYQNKLGDSSKGAGSIQMIRIDN